MPGTKNDPPHFTVSGYDVPLLGKNLWKQEDGVIFLKCLYENGFRSEEVWIELDLLDPLSHQATVMKANAARAFHTSSRSSIKSLDDDEFTD